MCTLHQKIDAGVKEAIAAAIKEHRRLGQSITFMRDDEMITLTGDEIPPRTETKNSGWIIAS